MANKKADFKLTGTEVSYDETNKKLKATDGNSEWESEDGKVWCNLRVPEVKKTEPSPPEAQDHVFLSMEYMQRHRDDITLTDSQKKISEIMDAMKSLLLYKNQKYGDSALKPKNIFYKGDATNSILIRLDDKIGRITANTESKPRVNDVSDIIGYCALLLVSMGVTREDIDRFKD